jgi:hypothetical protein
MAVFVADAADFAEIPAQAKLFLSGAVELSTAVALRVLELGPPSLEAAARYFHNADHKNEAQFAELLRDVSRIDYVRETVRSSTIWIHACGRAPIGPCD